MSTTYRSVLAKALERMGNRRNLAIALGTTVPTLAAYLENRRPIPEDVFLKAVDLLAEPPPAPGSRPNTDGGALR
jgi:hypothetical protein